MCALRRLALLAALVGVSGCAGGLRLEPQRFDDADLRVTVEVGAQARVALALANRSRAPIALAWQAASMVGPDHRLVPLPVHGAPAVLAPHARVEVAVQPVEVRPGAQLELIIPTVVRGVPREYHLHVTARR